MKSRQYKLIGIHLLFWLLNYLYITVGNLTWNGFDNSSGTLSIVYAYGLFFNALLFYIQVFYLVPKLFIKNKKIKYWLIFIPLLFSISLLESYMDWKVAEHYNLFKDSDFPESVYVISYMYHNFVFHIVYSIFGFFYRFLYEYQKSEKAKQELLKETHQTELKYLKAQLNPHFLFNGINSIYHLIGKNNSLAKNTLLQFSGLLRYQLYESGDAQILLEKELEYVTQYIQLEEIRRGEDIHLVYHINFEHSSLKIAPLLLTPFVENAFKHISHKNKGSNNKISISIAEEQNILTLQVENTCDENAINHSFGGVGLTNVKRRLELLYPEKHQLKIDKQQDRYDASLTINLS